MTRIQSLISPIRELVELWHSVDRIRISPDAGRLLRLQVGDRFVVFDSLYTVEQRRVESCDEGHNVVYLLSNSSCGREQLLIDATTNQTARGRLVRPNSEMPVSDSDVSILNAGIH